MTDRPSPSSQQSTVSGEARAATRGALGLAVFQTIGRIFGVSFALGATRVLVPAALGRYSTVSGIVLFCGFIADFGTSLAITRWISREPESTDSVLGGTLLVSLGIGVLTYVGAVGFALSAGYPGTVVIDVAIGALALPVAAVGTSLFAALDGRGMLDRRAFVTFVQSGVVALGGLVAILATGSVRAGITMIALGPVVGTVLAMRMLRRSGAWTSRIGFDRAHSRTLLSDALPYAALGGIAALTLRFDLVFVSVASTAAETARYDLALRSVEAVTFLAGVIAAPAIFLLTRRLTRGDRDGAQRALSVAARYSYLVGVPLSALLAVVADDAVALLYGQRYASVGTPLAILATQLWLGLLVSLLGSAIIAAGKGRNVIPVSAGIATVGVLGAILLVPHYGASGAAVASVVTQVVALGAFSVYLRDRTGLVIPLPPIALGLATGLAVVTTVGLRPMIGLAAGAAGAVAYLGCLVVTHTIGSADLAVVRAATRPTGAAPEGDLDD